MGVHLRTSAPYHGNDSLRWANHTPGMYITIKNAHRGFIVEVNHCHDFVFMDWDEVMVFLMEKKHLGDLKSVRGEIDNPFYDDTEEK